VSLYREPGQLRRRRRLIAGGVAAAVAFVAVLVILLAGGGGPPSHAERVAAARTAAGQALAGLELVEIEYGQAVKDGKVVEPTEYDAAKADVSRARDALAQHADDVRAVDAAALPRAQRALAAVGAAVAAKAPPEDVKAAVTQARATIQPLTR
jgi:hypothetical protein